MRSPVILRVYKGQQLVEVKQYDLDQIVIGRQADVQVDLPSEDVSPIHCLIERRDSGYYVCDLGSANGTKKNNQPVLDEAIASGDELQIGPFRINFFVGVPKPKGAPDGKELATPQAAPAPSAPVAPAAAATVASTPAFTLKEEPKKTESVAPAARPTVPARPEIRDRFASARARKKTARTFAPPSEIKDLKTHLKATKGNTVEVVVAWHERVIDTYHFRNKGTFRLGTTDKDAVRVAAGNVPKNFTFIDIGSAVRVNVADGMGFELIAANGSRRTMENCVSTGKASRSGNVNAVRLDQNEMIWISLGEIHLYVRFVAQTPLVPMLPPLGLSGTELSGLIMSFTLTALLAFYISATTPKDLFEDKQEEITRTAQVIFNTPPPKPPAPETPPPPPPPEKTPPPPPPEKAKVAEAKKDLQKKGEKTDKPASKVAQTAARASEVAPIPNSQNRPKKFTSRKSGGAVKVGQTEGANAASTKDMSKVGLFSAFGGGGVRAKLDQAYSGAGEVLGQADKATGTAGSNQNRAGDDLGSRFKDTGAGGKGTATQGIAGIGTKGRGSGQAAYGALDGFGSKTVTIVDPGDADEDFIGTIDKEAIRRRVRHYLSEIQGCYNRELNKLERGQKLEGKVVVSWEIIAQGAARNVRVKSSTLNNKLVEGCIRDRLASWSFPEPPKGMTAEVSYPFYFQPQQN